MHDFLNRLGCAGFVIALGPFEQQLFPPIADLMGECLVGAIQAVTVATLGQSLHAALYG
jgi:hypothetical protein